MIRRLKTFILNMLFIACFFPTATTLCSKSKYELDETAIVTRLNKIQAAFDTALAGHEIKKITAKLNHDIYNFYALAFSAAKKNLAHKDKNVAKKYLMIIKETADKLASIFENNNLSIHTEQIAGILFLCAFKANALSDNEPGLENCFAQLLACESLEQPLCLIAQDALILLITLAENAKKHLSSDDIKLFKLTENITAMKTIAKLFDGNFKRNLIKSQLIGPKISQKTIAEIVLFWTSLAPVYVTLERQIIEHNIADILKHIIAMTDQFIVQLN